MTVQEIINKILLMIDHDLTNEQVVGQLNELSKQLFRKFPLPDKVYRFETTSIPYYDLPLDCAEDRIRCVIINGTEYKKLTPEIQDVWTNFCTVFVGKLYINPNTSGQDAYLYYGQRHNSLSPNKLTETPNFPEDYHDLLVYGVAKWIAAIQRDVDLVNNFQSEYNEIEKEALRGLRKMGLKRAKITMDW